jgi:hypothetical protein
MLKILPCEVVRPYFDKIENDKGEVAYFFASPRGRDTNNLVEWILLDILYT